VSPFAGVQAQEMLNADAEEEVAYGSIYTRFTYSYQTADEYHSGSDSFASTVFNDLDGEYTFNNYTLDIAYTLPSGLYIASGIYSTAAEVKTNGLGLGVPNTDSDVELREIPLAIGYGIEKNGVRYKAEARYTFNVDDDFDNPFDQAVADAILLPVTDGSDYLTLSVQAAGYYFGLEHKATLAYQTYEEDVSHPVFPEFTLGDRILFDYEISLNMNPFRLFAGYLYVDSDETEGTASPVTGTSYLYNEPDYSQVRGGVQFYLNDRFSIEGGAAYIFDGEDAPKEETIYGAIVGSF
jgi:hypothetical protein